jgi:hypothetical protein
MSSNFIDGNGNGNKLPQILQLLPPSSNTALPHGVGGLNLKSSAGVPMQLGGHQHGHGSPSGDGSASFSMTTGHSQNLSNNTSIQANNNLVGSNMSISTLSRLFPKDNPNERRSFDGNDYSSTNLSKIGSIVPAPLQLPHTIHPDQPFHQPFHQPFLSGSSSVYIGTKPQDQAVIFPHLAGVPNFDNFQHGNGNSNTNLLSGFEIDEKSVDLNQYLNFSPQISTNVFPGQNGIPALPDLSTLPANPNFMNDKTVVTNLGATVIQSETK